MEEITLAYLTTNVTQVQDYSTTINSDSMMYDTYDDERSGDQNRQFNEIFYIVATSLASALGTTGNGLVIFFAIFRMKRTVNVVWFLNLAIADFIVMVLLPLNIAYYALENWPFDGYTCKLYYAVFQCNLFASVFLLTVISMDRCISVMLPVWSRNHRTPTLASIVAVMVWILAFNVSLPDVIFTEHVQTGERVDCTDNYANNKELFMSRLKSITITRFILSFAIPFTVIISCYTVILLRIRRNHITTSSKPFKITVAVITSFFVCRLPYHVFSFLEIYAYDNGDNHLLNVALLGEQLADILVYINSCINPVLYVFMGRDFKDSFRRASLKAIFERAFMEPSESKSNPE